MNLNALPYPWPDPEAQELHQVLVTLYPSEPRAHFVASKIGIETYKLTPNQPPLFLWREILDMGAAAGLNRDLVTLARDDNPRSPRRPFLDALLSHKPVPSAALSIEPRSRDGAARFLDGATSEITRPEALLFGDDLSEPVADLPGLITTLNQMLRLAPAVCMLQVTNGIVSGTGTAFLIGADLLLTNHHVLVPRGSQATHVSAVFGFDTGLPQAGLPCDPATIVTSQEDDWGIVKLSQPLAPGASIVDLQQAAAPTLGERSFILQHPGGGFKRLGFVRSTVTAFTASVVHYLTDTQEGSSGSPVFNAQGQLIALHHAGGAPQQVLGKAPLRKNEGIRISKIVAGLKARGVAIGA